MIAAAVHSAARPTPRRLLQPLHIPWYLHPDHATSERWFAAADFTAVNEATVRAASRPDLRESLDRAAKLTAEATRLGKAGDEAELRKAVTFHLYAAELRREAGAWSQSAENYGALTRHHLSCGKLKAAVAYLRKLLFVTEGASSPEERLDACLLAATVYVAVHQVTPARNHAVEAVGIAARTGDANGIVEAERRFAQIEVLANQRPTGKKVVRCACGEMKSYVECCGVADELPAEFQARAGAHGPQSGHASLWGLPGQAGIDLLMERPGRAGECLNWVGVRIEDGRQSLVTLPNWSGRAMRAARVTSRLSLSHPDATEHPWSTVLQVACGVEAFINAVEHFIAISGPERWAHIKFPDRTVEADPERQGSVVKRLAGIGAALFGPEWPKSMRLDDLGSLMALRNTLVHFNGDHEERIVPVALKEPAMLRRFKGCFEMRDAPRPWIDRVLTPGLATWAVDLGDGLIAAFRNSWLEQQERFASENLDWDHEEEERLAEA